MLSRGRYHFASAARAEGIPPNLLILSAFRLRLYRDGLTACSIRSYTDFHGSHRKAVDRTDCNVKPALFAGLGRKKIHADFDRGSLTSDAGAVLLRQVGRRSKKP